MSSKPPAAEAPRKLFRVVYESVNSSGKINRGVRVYPAATAGDARTIAMQKLSDEVSGAFIIRSIGEWKEAEQARLL